ncbi:4-hydroxyphenylpyruvate dioxygenase [Gammaproteobacteria bacterium 45_16_T64]|nr:4-hydroxyphenylpyruvate dioxygenase [Gammaproteobacteria bacterium 45_16_T64]
MSAIQARKSKISFNPAGTLGFSFVEFTSSDSSLLHPLLTDFGFARVSKHKTKPLTWYQQGDITFLVNDHPYGFTSDFEKVHGSSACAMGFSVEDAKHAFQYALDHGAKNCLPRALEFQVPAIYGIGDSLLYFIDENNTPINHPTHFRTIPRLRPVRNVGLKEIDHLTHNVGQGRMNLWSEFYEDLFNFQEIRYFDIKGKYTGLLSRAMTSPCGKIRIPINESADDNSQIEEYLQEYNGEGIQHIALTTDNIVDTVQRLRSNGIKFMNVPDEYYDQIESRLPGHQQDINRLREQSILIDGHKENGEWKLLLQIFTETLIGPIFFEIIQRLGDEGFGEGNFQALFEAMEADQIRRGVISVE